MFVHKKVTTGIPKELTFNVGTIFKVTDTLPVGIGKFWRVNRVDAYGNDKEEGFVPIEHLLSEINFISPVTSSLPNIFRNSAKRLNSHPGPDAFLSLRNEIHNVYELYQPIKKVKSKGKILYNQYKLTSILCVKTFVLIPYYVVRTFCT